MNKAGIVSHLLLLPSLDQAESAYAKFRWALTLAQRFLLLTTAILAIVVSERTVPLLSFRLAMAAGVLGAALALPRVLNPRFPIRPWGRLFQLLVIGVAAGINALLFVRPPGTNLGLAFWPVAFLVGGSAASFGAEAAQARKRDREAR